MSELGQRLREARLQKGLSLDDVQDMTKIRKRYLEAIEAGDYKVLPGTFYVRAFIKTYAETVGLNADELLEGHKKDVPAQEQEVVMEPVAQKRTARAPGERNVKWMSSVLIWMFPVLILGLLYVYIVMKQGSPPPAMNVAKSNNQIQVPANTQGTGSQQSGNQGTTAPTNGGGSGTSTPSQGQTDGMNGGASTGGQAASNNPATEKPEAGAAATAGITVTEDGKAGKTTIFKVSSASAAPVKVEIKSTGVSWLEVYRGQSPGGEKLQYGNTVAGNTLSFDFDERGLYIKSGFSSATAITVGGQPISDGKATTRIRLISGSSDAKGSNTTSADSDATPADSDTDSAGQ